MSNGEQSENVFVSQSTATVPDIVRLAWAKFDQVSGGWLPLFQHLEDTAAVADLLFPVLLSPSQRSVLADTFGEEELARRVAVWLGAVHDVGKASVTFAMQVPSLYQQMLRGVYVCTSAAFKRSEVNIPHATLGQLILRDFFADTQKACGGGDAIASSYLRLAGVVGAHHGRFGGADPAELKPRLRVVEGESGGEWAKTRQYLLKRASLLAGLDESKWAAISEVVLNDAALTLLNGFLIVCDWVASDERMFPYERKQGQTSTFLATEAVERLGFFRSWNPVQIADPYELFVARFGISSPRPMQVDAVKAAQQTNEPCLLLVEAPTGEGKTEAALAAAEQLAAKHGQNGIFVALPTRATANAMFSRVLGWLRNESTQSRGTHGSECAIDAMVPEGAQAVVALLHGKAKFNADYRSFLDRLSPHGVRDTDDSAQHESVTANEWCQGAKKAGFSDVVVGTIDQLLFASLKAKHHALRHLAYSSKVVVIDEVHAADTYMQSYLCRTLEWLGAYGVPVIALSATLPTALRDKLSSAYQAGAKLRKQFAEQPKPSAGRSWDFGRPIKRDIPDSEPQEEIASYPLIKAVASDEVRSYTPSPSGREQHALVGAIGEDNIIPAALWAARRGGCVAVVRNTVKQAQDTFLAIKGKLGEKDSVELMLLHSRFTVDDREAREKAMLAALGPNGSRPRGMIVVATQVIEASLDIDFDFMISDIAPIDSLLQRMGRLHRHKRDARPVCMERPQLLISGAESPLPLFAKSAELAGLPAAGLPPISEGGRQLDKVFRSSCNVYGEALLLRTIMGLREHFDVNSWSEGSGLYPGFPLFSERSGMRVEGAYEVVSPGDVSSLVQSCYSNSVEFLEIWADRFLLAEKERLSNEQQQQQRSTTFLLASPQKHGRFQEWNTAGAAEANDEVGLAQVRDAAGALEVILLRNTEIGSLCQREEAFRIAGGTLTVPGWIAPGQDIAALVSEIKTSQPHIAGWDESPYLGNSVPLVIPVSGCVELCGFDVSYSQELGMVIERRMK